MADTANTTPAARWNSALAVLHTLNQKLTEAQAHEADALERAIAEQEELLLDLEAPHFAAVAYKLKLLWETDLDRPDGDGATKRLIVEDLTNLIGFPA